MKKFLPYILALVLFVGIFAPLLTYAQATPPSTSAPTGSCFSLSSGIDVDACYADIAGVIQTALLTIMSLVLYLAGSLLNFVLDYTIIKMAANLSGMTGINIAWKVIRDLMNMAFIFLLVYEAIKIIIAQSTTAQIKKLILGIVLASILINFSLFFTKLLIDASNVVTVGFYNSILGPCVAPCSSGLSNPMMKAMGLSSYFDKDSINQFGQTDSATGNQMLIIGIFGSILFLVASFAFFAISIMFIIRYIVLIILLMLSPIGYMGMALPTMKPYANQWWEALKGQLLFGPIYMIMTWVVLTLMASPGFTTSLGSGVTYAGLLLGSGPQSPPKLDSVGLLVNYAVVIGLIIASVLIAKSTATKGSSLIGQATGKLTAFAGGAVLGTAASVQRNTVGRLGNRLANSDSLKDTAAHGGIITRNLAKATIVSGDKAAKSTFDARNTGVVKTTTGAMGMNLGKVDAKKENFRAIQDEKGKKAEEGAKLFKPSDLASAQAKSTLESEKFKQEEETRRREREEFVKSDQYKNTEEYKRDRALEDDIRKDKIKVDRTKTDIASEKAKIARMTKEMNDSTDEMRKAQYRDSILTIRAGVDRKQAEADDITAFIREREKAIKENEYNPKTWMSKEKKTLLATSGGQQQKKNDQGEIIQPEVKSAYQQRTEALANRVENENGVWRYTKNAFKIPLSLVTNITPVTKNDNRELARRIRKLAKNKSSDQLAKEALKQARKEEKERGEKVEEEEEDITPKEPETTTPPPITPPPTT